MTNETTPKHKFLKLSDLVIEIGNKLYIPDRKVIRESNKYKVYLPLQYRELWEYLRLNKQKVDVIIIIKNNER